MQYVHFGDNQMEGLLIYLESLSICLLQYLWKTQFNIHMNFSYDIQYSNNLSTTDLPTSTPKPIKTENITVFKAKSSKKSRVKMSSYSWSKTEEKRYISFIRSNCRLFSLSPQERKQIKINVLMCFAIKSRTSSQCHSHHQKMIMKYGSIPGIIQHHSYLYDKQVKQEVRKKEEASIPLLPQTPEEIIENQEIPEPVEQINSEPIWLKFTCLALPDSQEEEPFFKSDQFQYFQ